MCDIPVFYATTEGQTRRIAERLAHMLKTRGFDSRAIDVGTPDAWRIDWFRVRGAILGASLHAGKHQGSALAFARMHAGELHRCPSIFFSVSPGAASKHPRERAAARRRAEDFVACAHWQPRSIHCIGRLASARDGLLERLGLRMIATRGGGSTDTCEEHEYVDWNAVEQVAREMTDVVRYDAELVPLGA
jgi:menaquinone-dependent protoporphyrinogen oxidase